MKSCSPQEALRALFARSGGADEALLEHLAGCARCRQVLAAQQLRSSLAGVRAPRARLSRASWRPALALAAILSLAGLWFTQAPPPEPRWRAGEERPLQPSDTASGVQPRTGPLRLRWTPLPQAHGYRIVCHDPAGREWLRRALPRSEASLSPQELAGAPVRGVCRLDAELVDGGWVTGDERALVLQP